MIKRTKKFCQFCDKEFLIENWRLKDSNRGKFCSLKCTGMMSIKNLGKYATEGNPWNKGKHLSNIHKKHLQENHVGMFGKKHNEEFKRKMSQLKKQEKYMKILQKQFANNQPTSIEKKVYEELESRGLLFEPQKLINGKFIVDAYIPSFNRIIEVDGNYWHGLDRIKKKDKAENAYLTKCGFNLLRLTEDEINDGSFKERMVN